MKVAIGADHAGVQLKGHLVKELERLGHEPLDLGTHGTESVDYPPICAAVGRAVASGEAHRGIVLGGSGLGELIAAYMVHGVRAALCNDLFTAKLSREHNDANVLAIGARVTPPERALDLVRLFLKTEFEGGRHERRLQKVAALEHGAATAVKTGA